MQLSMSLIYDDDDDDDDDYYYSIIIIIKSGAVLFSAVLSYYVYRTSNHRMPSPVESTSEVGSWVKHEKLTQTFRPFLA